MVGALSASAVFMVTVLVVLNAFYVNITASERLIEIVLLSSTHSKNNNNMSNLEKCILPRSSIPHTPHYYSSNP